MSENINKVLQLGKNCWKVNDCTSLGILIEGEAYFKAAREAMLKARKRILLLAWEFHSQTRLLLDKPKDGAPVELGPFLNYLLERNQDLEVYILVWDFSLIYMMEREWKPFSSWLKNPHERLHFVSDTTAPTGASHHQKLLLVDDTLAFFGGLDLSISRWDTRQHFYKDERRLNPDGKFYEPYHDVHGAVTGDMVTTLSRLARERWAYATGQEMPALAQANVDEYWPQSVKKDFQKVPVACSLIFASPKENPSQIEQLHIDLFRAAKDLIFIENQYFSSNAITLVLEQKLQMEDGPEVVLLLPSTTSGWLVESTVGLLRDRLLEKLDAADRYDRLRVYAPMVQNDQGESKGVYVHSKLTIVDDRILKIGSSNLSNRSMKVDSEVDLTLEFAKADKTVRRIRHDLMAMHLGMSVEDWASLESKHNGLVSALDEVRNQKNRQYLKAYEYGCDSDLQRKLADTQLLDPDDPIDPQYWIEKVLEKEERPIVWKRVLSVVASLGLALLIGFGVVWLWGEVWSREEAVSWLTAMKESVWTPLWVFLLFVIGGIVGIPLNFLFITTTLVMGTAMTLLAGISGAIVSALGGFWAGRMLGKPLLEKFNSDTIERLSRKLGERSYRSVAVVRLIPIAPFFLINLFAGASHLSFRQYTGGIMLGMIPGMCAVIFLANRAEAVVRRPSWDTVAVFAGLLLFIVLGVRFLRKSFGGTQGDEEE